MPSLLSLLVPVSLFFTSVSSLTRLEDQSFYAPFTEYDSGGSRMVASYREGGVAKVNENFIRLTPDRQSKRGHLWSSRRVDVHDWSVVLEFRVSGQGKTLFGDGLAFWFTDMPNIRNGEVFGVVDDFKGFAVVFDTFRNQEFLAVHKDISVLTGDGKPGAGDRRNTERPGCDADFRCVYCCWWLVVGGVCFLIPFPSSRHVFVLYFPSSSHSFLFFFFFSSFSVSCVPFLHPFFSLSHSLSLSSSSSFFFLLLPSSFFHNTHTGITKERMILTLLNQYLLLKYQLKEEN